MFIESAFMDTTIKDAVVSADMTSCVALTFDLSTGRASKIRQRRVSSESLVMTAGDDDECINKAGEFSFFNIIKTDVFMSLHRLNTVFSQHV